MKTFKLGSLEWHKKQISAYKGQIRKYEELAAVVYQILDEARRMAAPLAVIQARAKCLSSFGEKALRQFKMDDPATHDPVHRLTDLCGARVITTTTEELEAVCELLAAAFEVEEFDDTSRRLKTTEFGYRSYHLIAQAATPRILGTLVPERLLHVRFEIQIRTMLQHAWSDVSHDRLYKSGFRVPDSIRRNMARAAALLEQAEEAFGNLVHDLETYKVNLGKFMTVESARKEIETLEIVMANERDANNKPGIAIRLACLYSASGEWAHVVKTLAPFENAAGLNRAELLARLGIARCQSSRGQPHSEAFKKGQANLAEIARPLAAVESKANPLRAKALAHLAWTHTKRPGRLQKASDLYRLSYESDPSNPYHLTAYLETRLRSTGDVGILEGIRPAIIRAIEACKRHTQVKIELPWAYLTLGRLELLLGHPFESLQAYAKAVQCSHNSGELEESLQITVELLNTVGKRMVNLEWVHRLLRVGMVVKEWEYFHKCHSARIQAAAELAELIKHQSKGRKEAEARVAEARVAEAGSRRRVEAVVHKHIIDKGLPTAAAKEMASPVVIVAGAARSDYQEKANTYRDYLTEGFRGFSGVAISGGTRAGIPGELGEVTRLLAHKGERRFKLFSYLPKTLPAGAKQDPAYTVFHAGENDFDASQPLQYWIDILAAGLDPASVRLLGINGGKIAALEYRVGLMAGAKVGIIHKSGNAGDELIPDADWADSENLLPLPMDRMTLRAFIQSTRPHKMVAEKHIDALGRKIHENYRRENIARLIESGMQDWECLREDFKRSNCDQATYAEQILQSCGFEICPGEHAVSADAIRFTPDEVELMAEMEHGRWVVERLHSNWRYGKEKDPAHRISPDLIPWDPLPDYSKERDRQAVRNFPRILREAGLEVRRPRATTVSAG